MSTKDSKEDLLKELNEDGLLSNEDRNELYDIIVEDDKKQLEIAKNKFYKAFEEYKNVLFC